MKLYFAMVLSFLAFGTVLGAESDLERLQAAFIQKIINYVEWPSSGGDQFIISIHDNKQLFEVMKNALDEKVINGKTAKVIKGDKNSKHAHIVCGHHPESFKAYADEGILFVTNDVSGLQGKAVLNFIIEDGKLRFDINQSRAIENKIKINSRLLKLARQIK